MSDPTDRNQQDEWEGLLREGLDQLAVIEEEPPQIAALQMLVADVQQAQRKQLRADLLKFGGVAVLLLSVILYGFLRAPLSMLIAQGSLALLSLVGVGLWHAGSKRVME